MKFNRLNLETSLLILAVLLALFVRLYDLGAAPLTDQEAAWAMQALQVARPSQFAGALMPGPQPAYIFLTGAVFSMFGASEFWARFWPALAGALLAALPLCLRREPSATKTQQRGLVRLGRGAMVILAFGLALDPGLATVSRQAGGPMLALSFSLLALGLWYAGKPGWAGLLGGLALLSGPALVQGVLGLGLAWAISHTWQRHSETRFATLYAPPQVADADLTDSIPAPKAASRLGSGSQTALLAGGATVLLVGTYFLRYPQGLAAGFAALLTYLRGWISPSTVTPGTLVLALLVHQPFALIFAIVGLIRWAQRRIQGLESESGAPYQSYSLLLPLLWALISLALALLYPARQTSDLVWTLVPVWALAAVSLANYLPENKPHVITLAQGSLILILCGLYWNTLISTGKLVTDPGVSLTWVRLAVLVGIFALGTLTTALVALGWSWPISRDGLVWGLSLAFIVYLTSALSGAAYLRPNQPAELWGPLPGTGQAYLLQDTLAQLSTWQTGFPTAIDVVVIVDAPSLRWLLRDYPQARFVSGLAPDEQPAIIISRQQGNLPEQQSPAVTAAYRGQDFSWWVRPAWEGAVPPDFITWLTFRQAPVAQEHIILWARSDLFPGAAAQPVQEEP